MLPLRPLLAACALLVVHTGNATISNAQNLGITGGPVHLLIGELGLGGELVDVEVAGGMLEWRGGAGTKITVATDCPGQSFQLYARAQNPTRGTPAPEASLYDGMLPADFILSIPGGPPATAAVIYRAAADITDGNSLDVGEDFHVVTFTITAQ